MNKQQILAAATATRVVIGKFIRAMRALFNVVRRHVPAWVGVVLTVCLFIPGPLDEFLLLIVIAVFAAFKPAMRSDIRSEVSAAWRG